MKQLTLIRHAKSSWEQTGLDDIQRPLNPRGLRNAQEMGERLQKRGLRPDRVLVSPATRALATAELLLAPLALHSGAVIIEASIYEATTAELLDLLCNQPQNCSHLLLIGHNPGLTELANCLGNIGIDNIPTCGVCDLIFPDHETWDQITEHTGRIAFFDSPKHPTNQSNRRSKMGKCLKGKSEVKEKAATFRCKHCEALTDKKDHVCDPKKIKTSKKSKK